MEKAILKTLTYFGYPLKAWEIHKWLIGKKSTLPQVERTLLLLNKKDKILNVGDYYFLGKSSWNKRIKTESNHLDQLKRSKLHSQVLRLKRGVRLLILDKTGLIDVTEEMSLDVKPRNLENALRVLSLKVLWQKNDTWSKVLEENSWVFKYFPNFISNS